MSETDLSDGDPEPSVFQRSGLTRQLDKYETRMLEVVWSALHVERQRGAPHWPMWDWVSRQVIAADESYPEPSDVLDHLPTVRHRFSDQRYGLIWRTAPSGQQPALNACGIDVVATAFGFFAPALKAINVGPEVVEAGNAFGTASSIAWGSAGNGAGLADALGYLLPKYPS